MTELPQGPGDEMALQHTYGTVDTHYAVRLATTPAADDGPVFMVNLMRYHERAQYADGDRGLTGRQADDLYSPIEVLADLGAEITLFGDVERQLLGASPPWDRVACVTYPTRRSFMDMQEREDFQAKHVHKAAGMSETIILGCQPFAPPVAAAEATYPDWADVPHPPTPEDGPIVVVHVIKYVDGAARARMSDYQDVAFGVAGPHGARIGGWYDVEGTIVGDGRSWDQVRFNLFPSAAAFMAVVRDPARLEAQKTHREAAIADTYALIVRPLINRFASR